MTNSTSQPQPPSFWSRIPLAFGAFFSTLSDPAYAARVRALSEPAVAAAPVATAPTRAPEPAQAAPAPVRPLKEASPDAALQLLALLQREARLIDFTQENLTAYSDADIGAAARVVHEGCSKVLREHFTIEPVRTEAEGSRIVLENGFDAGAVRLTGNVVGSAPFRGSLSHRGWRAASVRLPKLTDSHDASVLAPAEVEL
ncbi:hypothetical protein ACFDR9_002328 [Janthinobacterium sp. CG_23.3]|uniref:DUF2760 domain-containing protein n=1 Tax=unclassified Janthinobacterium TaxID=2610881 RepID=UPI000348C399|nr:MULTISPECIES: DUF2760 domain-containing protein [unclassified Janthinobacterium]MEC5160531.1 hypothetical protein [Janthinobacterium sp. CG_S6]